MATHFSTSVEVSKTIIWAGQGLDVANKTDGGKDVGEQMEFEMLRF